VADRVMVFVDYQNVYGWARRQFHGINPASAEGHVDPLLLGEHLVSRRQRPSELEQVRVYAGWSSSLLTSSNGGCALLSPARATKSRSSAVFRESAVHG